MINLHPYDGKERVFTHRDSDTNQGIDIISKMLGISPPIEGLTYSLSFYSGGVGIIDDVAVSMKVNNRVLREIKDELKQSTPLEATQDEEWAEDFVWLVTDEDVDLSIEDHVVNFLNENRKEFQAPCTKECEIYFLRMSDVNSWSAIYVDNEQLHYLAYMQG